MRIPRLPLLALAMMLLPSACMTSEYARSSLPERRTLTCKALGETAPSQFVIKAMNLNGVSPQQARQNWQEDSYHYYLKCPAKMNQELAAAPDLRAKFLECLPKYREALRTADESSGSGFKARLAFKKDELKLDHGRNPGEFDPAKLNLIWTVPVDVVTSPIQAVVIIYGFFTITC